MPDTETKTLWPGWETVRLIGRGSFGAVYEIERDVFGEKEKAALKLITIPQSQSDIDEMRTDGYDDESITDTFKGYLKSIVAEYSLMRRLNGCSNVVNCDDVRYVQHADGYGWDIFIKMELLTPLTAALPDEIPEEQAVRIGRDVCRALSLCRQFNIVHRDIKPQNIFVSPLGDYKLGDFGIAKTVEKTSGGTKIGTYKYMAPEVYNNRPYGHTADIYSLGLVLYWLLNERRLPFLPLPPEKLRKAQEEEARLRRLGGEPIPAPAHGSDELKRIVLKACAYDPKERYQSADELLRELEALLRASTPAEPQQQPAAPLPGRKPEPDREPESDREPEPKPSAAPDAEDDEATVSGPLRRRDELAPPPAPDISDAAPQDNADTAAQDNVDTAEQDNAAPAAPKKKKRLALAAAVVALVLAAVLLIVLLPKGKKENTAAESLPGSPVGAPDGQSGTEQTTSCTEERIDLETLYALHEPGDVIGTINGSPVTWEEYFSFLYDVCTQLQDSIDENSFYAALSGEDHGISWSDPIDGEDGQSIAEYAREAAEGSLAQIFAIEKLAEENGVTLSDEDRENVAALIEDFKTRCCGEGASDEEFDAYLASIYMPRSVLERYFAVNFLHRDLFAALYGENGSAVTDEDALEFMQSKGAVCLTHIMFSQFDAETGDPLDEEALEAVRLQAEELAAELRAIEDPAARRERFDELKNEHCVDPNKEDFPQGYVVLPEEDSAAAELRAAVEELGDYEVSDPIRTSAGYHIVMRLPLDPDMTIKYSLSGTPLTARSLFADTDFRAMMDERLASAQVEFVDDVRDLDLRDYVVVTKTEF